MKGIPLLSWFEMGADSRTAGFHVMLDDGGFMACQDFSVEILVCVGM